MKSRSHPVSSSQEFPSVLMSGFFSGIAVFRNGGRHSSPAGRVATERFSAQCAMKNFFSVGSQ